MSLDAIKWALGQAVGKASTKFVLVAMADCVNTEAGAMVCWPSYAYLARITHHDIKTVEVAVHRLKEVGLIVDTGTRRGETGKVVVYRLNTTKSGGIEPGPQSPDASGYGGANGPESGFVSALSNPPVFPVNDPKNGYQSPQISGVIPPKTGVRTRKKQEGTGKEAKTAAHAIDGVQDALLNDWLAVRRDKRAGTLTATAVAGLEREAAKAGITVADAVRYCVEQNWIGFNAGWYADRTKKTARAPQAGAGKHSAAARAIWGDDNQQDYSDAQTH